MKRFAAIIALLAALAATTAEAQSLKYLAEANTDGDAVRNMCLSDAFLAGGTVGSGTCDLIGPPINTCTNNRTLSCAADIDCPSTVGLCVAKHGNGVTWASIASSVPAAPLTVQCVQMNTNGALELAGDACNEVQSDIVLRGEVNMTASASLGCVVNPNGTTDTATTCPQTAAQTNAGDIVIDVGDFWIVETAGDGSCLFPVFAGTAFDIGDWLLCGNTGWVKSTVSAEADPIYKTDLLAITAEALVKNNSGQTGLVEFIPDAGTCTGTNSVDGTYMVNLTAAGVPVCADTPFIPKVSIINNGATSHVDPARMSGSSAQDRLVSTTSATINGSRCARFDAEGNLVEHSVDCTTGTGGQLDALTGDSGIPTDAGSVGISGGYNMKTIGASGSVTLNNLIEVAVNAAAIPACDAATVGRFTIAQDTGVMAFCAPAP